MLITVHMLSSDWVKLMVSFTIEMFCETEILSGHNVMSNALLYIVLNQLWSTINFLGIIENCILLQNLKNSEHSSNQIFLRILYHKRNTKKVSPQIIQLFIYKRKSEIRIFSFINSDILHIFPPDYTICATVELVDESQK